jgi:hypothetical protein
MEHIIEKQEFYGEAIYTVCELTTYEASSVLAGQEKKQFVDEFDSLDSAKAEYPNAQVIEGRYIPGNNMSDIPPSWFDPTYAGEEW